MSAGNVFSDTNIFIYAYSATEPDKKAIAVDILKQPITISVQVVNEFQLSKPLNLRKGIAIVIGIA